MKHYFYPITGHGYALRTVDWFCNGHTQAYDYDNMSLSEIIPFEVNKPEYICTVIDNEHPRGIQYNQWVNTTPFNINENYLPPRP